MYFLELPGGVAHRAGGPELDEVRAVEERPALPGREAVSGAYYAEDLRGLWPGGSLSAQEGKEGGKGAPEAIGESPTRHAPVVGGAKRVYSPSAMERGKSDTPQLASVKCGTRKRKYPNTTIPHHVEWEGITDGSQYYNPRSE